VSERLKDKIIVVLELRDVFDIFIDFINFVCERVRSLICEDVEADNPNPTIKSFDFSPFGLLVFC